MFAREFPGVSLGLTTNRRGTCAILPDGDGHNYASTCLSILVNTLGLVDNPYGSTVNCHVVPL